MGALVSRGEIIMANILIMEPDARISAHMEQLLTQAGHQCYAANHISDGLACLQKNDDRLLTVLNARMPWTDSFTFLKAVREKGWPVLFTTTSADNIDHLRAMYPCSCDVLLTPFTDKALLDAVSTLLCISDRMLTFGALQLDVLERQATLNGEALTLTAQEFALLQALMESPNAALTREQLLRTAWGYQGIGETRTVDVHVQRLRRKLGASCIETVYKLGYRLNMA